MILPTKHKVVSQLYRFKLVVSVKIISANLSEKKQVLSIFVAI